jgi:hypothetical protein
MTTHPLEVPLALVASRAGDGLDALRCRDDILQAMFWMRGEGFGEATDARGLSRLISADEDFVAAQLEVLAGDGHLEPDGDRYRLSPSGQHEGGRRFADEFAGSPAHGARRVPAGLSALRGHRAGRLHALRDDWCA